MLYFPEFDNLT